MFLFFEFPKTYFFDWKTLLKNSYLEFFWIFLTFIRHFFIAQQTLHSDLLVFLGLEHFPNILYGKTDKNILLTTLATLTTEQEVYYCKGTQWKAIKLFSDPVIQSVDWYIAPLLNPDGYEYTHIYMRLWRKNRFVTHS